MTPRSQSRLTRRDFAMPARIRLPKLTTTSPRGLHSLLVQRKSVRDYRHTPISLDDLSHLLFAAQGITNRREEIRSAPSAGALYPLEMYAVIERVENIPAGVYRYQPKTHALQLVVLGSLLEELAEAAWQQEWIGDAAILLIYTAVTTRTTKKYGHRGLQYIYIETGHAAQNVFLSAIERELASAVVGAFDSRRVRTICRMKKNETVLYFQTVGVAKRRRNSTT